MFYACVIPPDWHTFSVSLTFESGLGMSSKYCLYYGLGVYHVIE